MNIRTRTATLKKATGGNFRLLKEDREFLSDLSRVRLICEEDANQYHYKDRKTSSTKRLNKLVEEGLLTRIEITVPKKGKIKTYCFANEHVARKYKSKMPSINRMRNGYHELIVSRIYFVEDRPESFKLEADFNEEDKLKFRRLGESSSNICLPDASFLDESGKIVAVEADSGQYNSNQIKKKINSWAGIKQVWGQPQARKSAVENFCNATVHRF